MNRQINAWMAILNLSTINIGKANKQISVCQSYPRTFCWFLPHLRTVYSVFTELKKYPLLGDIFLITAAAAAAIRSTVAKKLTDGRRAKLVHRERHPAEKAARIVLVLCGTFFIGHAIIGSGDQILRRALNANDREYPKRDEKLVPFFTVVKRTTHTGDHALGDLAAATAAAAAIAPRLRNASRKENRVHHLNHPLRNVGAVILRIAEITRTYRGIAAVNVHVADAPVENDLFLNDGNTAEFLVSTDTHAGFHIHLDIEADGYLIEALVKSDRIHPDVGPKDLGAFRTNIGDTIHNILPEGRKKYADVLVTIAVTARIQNAECIDANGFPFCGGTAKTGRAFMLRHLIFPLYIE